MTRRFRLISSGLTLVTSRRCRRDAQTHWKKPLYESLPLPRLHPRWRASVPLRRPTGSRHPAQPPLNDCKSARIWPFGSINRSNPLRRADSECPTLPRTSSGEAGGRCALDALRRGPCAAVVAMENAGRCSSNPPHRNPGARAAEIFCESPLRAHLDQCGAGRTRAGCGASRLGLPLSC